MAVYYNENEPIAAHVLECLIRDGVIADGIVDRRSIEDVTGDDLEGFTQHHFFAGGGLWSVALRLAGWPDDRPVWTGSCPCQPFSIAGKGRGVDDKRHLWPQFHRLIAERRPAIVFGEQVGSKAGREWLSGVLSDLEALGYAGAGADLCAAGVGAPHIRQRIYWVANAAIPGLEGRRLNTAEMHLEARHCDARPTGSDARDMVDANDAGCREQRGPVSMEPTHPAAERAGGGDMADADGGGWNAREPQGSNDRCISQSGGAECRDLADADDAERWEDIPAGDDADRHDAGWSETSGHNGSGGFWDDAEWLTGADGKTRRAKPGVRLLADGYVGRVGLLRIAGNAIVPQVAEAFIRAVDGFIRPE